MGFLTTHELPVKRELRCCDASEIQPVHARDLFFPLSFIFFIMF